MYRLILKPHAVSTAAEAYQWYEEKSKGLGEVFLSELHTCFKKIESNPKLFGKIKKNFRQIKLKRFPYVIIYEVIETEVVVFVVFHTSRNPKYKFKR